MMTLKPLALLLLAAPLAAQVTVNPGTSSSAADFHWQKVLAPGSTVSLHNISGDVHVTAGSGTAVEVIGRKHGNRRYFDDVTLQVVESATGIVVCAMYRDADMECDDRGVHMHDGHHDDDYDVDIDIEVQMPKTMRVDAHSVSGDVMVSGAEGEVRGGSVSGDVQLLHLRANAVKASSVSGDVDVSIDALTGDGTLKFTSVSGDVTVTLPPSIDADVTMRSVSGDLDTDFPLTLNGRMDRHALEARIGRGGRALDVSTVSGDVKLRSPR
jgi:hypothetical protein